MPGVSWEIKTNEKNTHYGEGDHVKADAEGRLDERSTRTVGSPWPPPSGWKKYIIKNGVPYSEVIQALGGGNIVAENKPLFCSHCDKDLIPQYDGAYAHAPMSEFMELLSKRQGKITRVTWSNGWSYWGCGNCGRKVEQDAKGNWK